MDERTKLGSMYHYPRVLIEIDMTKGCEDFIMFETFGQVRFASLKYEQLPPFCNHCGIVGHSLENCRSVKVRLGETGKAPTKGTDKPQKINMREGEWVRKGGRSLEEPPLEEPPISHLAVNNQQDPIIHVAINNQQGLASTNSFALLVDVDDREDLIAESGCKALPDANVEHMVDNFQPSAQGEGDLTATGTLPVVDGGHVAASGSSSLRPDSHATVAKHRAGKSKVTKDYNLRNKPLVSSPMHENNYTISSNVNTEALASMRMVSTRSWADQCEEENDPPKHGADRVSQ